jgi:hypothetical protein
VYFTYNKKTEIHDSITPVLVIAKYNFVSRKNTELSIIKGDVIKVLNQHKSGWWKGELNGNVGRFPSNYCVPMVRNSVEEKKDLSNNEQSRERRDSKVHSIV